MILIPEVSIDLEQVCESIKQRHGRGKTFSIVAVSEGAHIKDRDVVANKNLDQFGHVRLGGIGNVIGNYIEEKTGYETRVTVLGHIQRGGSPTNFDRILGTRLGVAAVHAVARGEFATMVALKGNQVMTVPISSAVDKQKFVDPEGEKIQAARACGMTFCMPD